MNTRRAFSILTTTVLSVLMVALPAIAAETPDGKSALVTESPRSIVGAFVLMAMVLMVFAACVNAVQQLRGKRRQADGKFRWR